MKLKSEKCLYCDAKLEAKTTRQRFCSDKCRVYWNRENSAIKVSHLQVAANVSPIAPHKPKRPNNSDNQASPASEQKPEIPAFKNEIERMFWEEKQKLTNKNK